MKKVGVFGLSGDPPHYGHMAIVTMSLDPQHGGMNEVIVVPSNNHAFKTDQTPADIRLEMCRATFSEIPNVIVSDIAIRLDLSGRHWDLMDELEKYYSLQSIFHQTSYQLYLILGGDVFNDIRADKWYRGNELLEKYPSIVFQRGLLPKPNIFSKPISNVKVIHFNIEFSSSVLRTFRPSSLHYYCYPKVVEIIKERRLYRYANQS